MMGKLQGQARALRPQRPPDVIPISPLSQAALSRWGAREEPISPAAPHWSAQRASLNQLHWTDACLASQGDLVTHGG